LAPDAIGAGCAARVEANKMICGPGVSIAVRPVLLTAPAADAVGSGPQDADPKSKRPSNIIDAESQAKDDLPQRLWALLQPPLAALVSPGGMLDWPAPIKPFQKDGIAVLVERREVLLADEMGLGKTIQAIAALRVLAYRGVLNAALVVCPASLLIQWYREFERWAPELVVVLVRGRAEDRAALWRMPAHVKLVSYDTLRGDVLDVRDSPALMRTWDAVVLDEASRIKNRETGISLACRRLPRARRWALTGTPLENRTEDVETILEFLLGDPQRPRLMSAHRWSLREDLALVQLRRKKADVLADLPPKEIQEVWLELHPRQRLAYDEAEATGVVRLKESAQPITVTHVLELISRLKQICNHDPVSSESAKLDDIAARLDEITATGERALVFSQYTDGQYGVRWIARALAGFRPLEYTGAMSAAERQRVVDEFERDPDRRVMALSLRAGGLGLNLQSASYVFHMDRWWNPAIESQAEDRTHRMGQTAPVTVYRYICAGTIEERIDAKLRVKRALFSEIVDDVSLDLATALSERELFGLFGLEPPSRGRKGAASASPET